MLRTIPFIFLFCTLIGCQKRKADFLIDLPKGKSSSHLNDSLYMKGVEVGEVRLISATRAEVYLKPGSPRLSEDDVFHLRVASLLGDYKIEVNPAVMRGTPLTPTSVVKVVAPPEVKLEDVIEKIKRAEAPPIAQKELLVPVIIRLLDHSQSGVAGAMVRWQEKAESVQTDSSGIATLYFTLTLDQKTGKGTLPPNFQKNVIVEYEGEEVHQLDLQEWAQAQNHDLTTTPLPTMQLHLK